MGKRILIGLSVVFFGLAAIVVIRTVRLSYDMPNVGPVERHEFDVDAAVGRLARAIQYQTISHQEAEDRDTTAFEGFIHFLEEAFPLIHAHTRRERVGTYTLLYRWEGRDPELEPAMLMGHYDVVPVEPGTENEWRYPPFAGIVADGYVWGRGAIDDKSGTLSTFEAVEYLIASGYTPERTVLFAANHDEEVGGYEGAAQVAERLKQESVALAFLVDEGMPVAEEIIGGIESPLAMIGVAEKGNLTIELSITNDGGHASMPPRKTAIGDLAAAIQRLKDRPMPGRFGDLIQRSFEPVSTELPFVYRMGLANLWLFRPVIERRLSQIPHTNAALRTTVAPTIFHAGVKTNVLPAHARAVVNFRIHPNDDVASVLEHVARVINNPEIEIRPLDGAREASRVSNIDVWPYERLKRSIWETFDEIPIAPSIFVAASDSRHFHDLTDNIYRFRPFRARPEDRSRIHGTDERIGVENYAEMVQFQIRLLLNMTGTEESTVQ